MKITAIDIIQESLEMAQQDKQKANYSVIDKLFDFSSFERNRESKEKSRVITYLSDRILRMYQEQGEHYHRMETAVNFAKDTVARYSPDDYMKLQNKLDSIIK